MRQKAGTISIEEKICKKLKELGTEIFNYKENEIIPLADEQMKKICLIKSQKNAIYAKKSFVKMKIMKMNLN